MARDATSFASGESCRRSSRIPTTNIASDASSTGTQTGADARISARPTTARKPASVPAAMAIPPIVGVGALCHRSERGGTTAPTVGAHRRTSAPAAMVTATATINGISSVTSASGCYEIRRPGAAVAENERRPGENAVTDGIQAGRLAWQELLHALELEAIDRIA